MIFDPPLIQVTIRDRYKRFLSDIELESGEVVCAHVPNTGAMTSCWAPGWKAYISESTNPKRKLKYTLEMTDNGKSLISVNTFLTNKLAFEALKNNVIEQFTGYENIKPEVKILDSRIDFFLTNHPRLADAYIEVKNATLREDLDIVSFPDAVSTRGQKHITDLIELKRQGYRAAMLYIVNREDVEVFIPAAHIDPEYASLLELAYNSGVEILAYQASLSSTEIKVAREIPVLI